MMMISNKEISDMYNEVQKSLLSKHGDAFAMSGSEAVDQMIGFEQLKRTIGGGVKNNNGDTSSAVLLLYVSAVHQIRSRCVQRGRKGLVVSI